MFRVFCGRKLSGELIYEREGMNGRVDVEPEFLEGEMRGCVKGVFEL
jgi:hypothetical protein